MMIDVTPITVCIGDSDLTRIDPFQLCIVEV
jgi:hypothetical protein